MQKKDQFMQISTPEAAPLERHIHVTIPASEVESGVSQRLRNKARSARLPGFRPGKAPMTLIERHYGSDALMETFDHLINERYSQAVRDESLRPVGRPEVQVEKGGRGEDLVFTAVVEVYPEFDPQVPDATVIRKTAEVTDADVDATIDIMRQQRRFYVSAERPAQDEDRVTVDFQGTIDGVPMAGGDVTNYSVVLGSGRLLPDIEQGLLGMSAGEDRTVAVQFPAEYHVAELAGQAAQFHLQVREVAAPQLPEVDAAFALALGIEDGDVAVLRQEVRENLEREAQRISRGQVKAQILDLVVASNHPDLPRQMIGQELERLQKDANAAAGGDLDALARRRVVLGLVLSEIVRREKLRASPAEVTQVIRDMSEQYEDPEQFISWYRSNPEQMEQAEALVLEDKVVAWLLERVKVSDEAVSFNQLIGRAPTGETNAE
ncbi:trigger factor [Acidithiobacillus ferrooxidans]|jgi:trigger factor|uniref:Trigger factor n=3 Tax=Acidithiobacillaceae TaxID=225058 RepID=B7J789_ACIF2|nr:trigger factor [Acidithiobacillus ferrooxidans ATCC 53993]ACK78312.1 trigger factor [Acidithiobacillus ferrooxidans ATCC 23270]EGQ61562.1 trigger factor [Acidithiobacillus sp. GGI-221]MBN6744847.1 trigger factor [Acidithiobacillus sp. MC2.2]MBN6747812.1 trigger factor [Acidithiobacillus sp. PG05]MBU2775133.1 trigger factor [Acidithiobacillus ferrooxidans]